MLKFGYIKYGLIAIMSASLLCGCSENGYEGWHNEPMSFTATISYRKHTRATADSAMAGSNLIVVAADTAKETVENAGKKTRASTTPDGTWPSGANVAMQISGNSNTTKYAASTGTVASGSPLYWTSNGNVTVNSWYPYSSSMPSSWTVQGDQSASDASGYNNSDFLYASNTFTYGGGNNNKLTYNHGTAKVVINIAKANDVTSASSVSSVTIGTASSQIDLSGTVNSGAITATTSTIGYIKPYQTTPADATNYVATYSALVIPQDVSNKQFIAVTVGSNTYYYKPTSLALQGGNEYDYNVTIPPSANSPLTPGKYYLLDNGAVSTLPIPSGRTAIAVVFSNRIGPEEQAKGYHNYAIALKDVSGSTYTWGPYAATSLTDRQTVAAYYSDLSSGYVGTNTYGMASSTYPAFLAAKNYSNTVAVPTTIANSGWYLPSMGQWWDVIANLGKLDMSSYQSSTANASLNVSTSTAMSNVNSCFTAAGGSALIASNYYWSSSEYSSDGACYVYFNSSGVLLTYNYKSPNVYVRSVLAF